MVKFYIYYNIYTHIHTHIHIYIYIYIYLFIYLFINIKNSGKPETVHRYWLVFEIYRTAGQTDTTSGMILTPLGKEGGGVCKNHLEFGEMVDENN